LDEIHSWLKQLATVYPNDVELINIGKSYEGRDILGVKLNKRKESGKKQIVFEGTMHAREWISAASLTWILNELITSKDPLIKELASTYEWNIIPVVNVDGYEYSWTSDRLWRRTRRPVNERCVGIDPNRNFDIYFNQTVSFPCAQDYPGLHPFTEPETKQFSEFLANLDNLVGFFSFHSYSQYLLMPYGYTTDQPDNYDVLYDIGLKAIKSLETRFGTQYKVGSISELLRKYSIVL
jgi:murein tripeptide amidase MpaA